MRLFEFDPMLLFVPRKRLRKQHRLMCLNHKFGIFNETWRSPQMNCCRANFLRFAYSFRQRFVHPALTSVAQNTRMLDRLTAQCLLERIADLSRPQQHHIIVPVLQVRGSSSLLQADCLPSSEATGIA